MKNNLRRKDEFRLVDWVRANQGKFVDITREEAAIKASEELAVSVKVSNLMNVIRDLGIKIKFKIIQPTRVTKTDRLKRLEQLVDHLYTRLAESKPE